MAIVAVVQLLSGGLSTAANTVYNTLHCPAYSSYCKYGLQYTVLSTATTVYWDYNAMSTVTTDHHNYCLLGFTMSTVTTSYHN